MPLYLVRCRYTPEAWQGLVTNPEDRTELAEQVCERFGGKLHNLFFAFGDHDLIEIIEAPNNQTMMAIMMASASAGSLTDITTTVLVSASEARDAMAIAGEQPGTYRRPGED